MAQKRTCHGTTKAGAPCGATPLKPGTQFGDYRASGDYCNGHDPDLPAEYRIGGAQPGAGRPKKPRAVDILRTKLEADADRVLDPLFDALEADIAIPVGSGEEAAVDYQPDHRTRLLAVKEILDRVYGRPKQATEITGPQGGPVSVVDISDPETRDAVSDLLRLRPAAPRDDG